jgi:hypothetical protein
MAVENPNASALPNSDIKLICAICLEISDAENPDVNKQPCPQCRSFFCKNHTSKVDPDYCDNCSRVIGVETKDAPLIDEEGVSHNGRSIQLTGEFWMSMQVDLAKMGDDELRRHVETLRGAVREAEIIKDYRKIALGRAENELEDRDSAKGRRLRILYEVRSGRVGTKVLSFREPREKKPRKEKTFTASAVYQSLMSLGLTHEQIINLLKKKGGM